MRAHHVALGSLLLATSIACNKPAQDSEPKGEVNALAHEAKAEAEVSDGLRAKLQALVPRLGGSLVALGDHWLELAIHDNGLVEGLLFDKNGELLGKPEAAEMSVKLRAEGGVQPVADLKWEPQSDRFVGKATAGADAAANATGDATAKTKAEAKASARSDSKAVAKAEKQLDTELALVPEPVEVTAKVDGKAQTATLAEYALLSPPEFGGTILSAGSYKAELIARPDGNIQAFVADARGAKLDGRAKVKLKARFGAKAEREVELDWHPGHACFVGKLDGGAKLRSEPVSLSLDAGGKSQLGGLAKLAVTVDAKPDAAVVVAGEFPVELSTKAGFIEASVFDAEGNARADGDLDLRLFAGADARKGLKLSWHAPSACYRGKIDAKLDLHAEPVRVELVNAGRVHVGAAASLKAAREARFAADAKLAGDAKLGADAKLAAKLPALKGQADLKGGAKADLRAAADAKAKAEAAAAAKANSAANLNAKAAVAVPKPTVEVKKSASASADTTEKGTAKASVKAGFSLGTK